MSRVGNKTEGGVGLHCQIGNLGEKFEGIYHLIGTVEDWNGAKLYLCISEFVIYFHILFMLIFMNWFVWNVVNDVQICIEQISSNLWIRKSHFLLSLCKDLAVLSLTGEIDTAI